MSSPLSHVVEELASPEASGPNTKQHSGVQNIREELGSGIIVQDDDATEMLIQESALDDTQVGVNNLQGTVKSFENSQPAMKIENDEEIVDRIWNGAVESVKKKSVAVAVDEQVFE